MKILSRKITEATVNNLYPGREYEFMVLSQDKHGDGMFSKALRIFTQPTKGSHGKIVTFQAYLNMQIYENINK